MKDDCVRLTGIDLARLDRVAMELVEAFPSRVAIGLVGTLGAGKTTLVQALARAANIDAINVTSPTFTLLHTYEGNLTLHHLDAYRLADEDEFVELGVDELLEQPGAWTVVEWADRVREAMPRDTLWLELTIQPDGRAIQWSSDDPHVFQRARGVVERLQNS